MYLDVITFGYLASWIIDNILLVLQSLRLELNRGGVEQRMWGEERHDKGDNNSVGNGDRIEDGMDGRK